jgi:selT/selW/selH-like putative selenoprotein
LEEELRSRFGAHIELIAGVGGVYEVMVDGKEVFSKAKLNRFPEDGEIVTLIESL